VTPPPSPSRETSATQTKPSTPALPPEPETFDSLSLKGDLAFQQGKYQDALNAYSKAYKLNPYNREARRKIAVTLTLLGRVDEAAKYQ
jgi:cytochrome c-type biogenesis protein CcmH/NrfG